MDSELLNGVIWIVQYDVEQKELWNNWLSVCNEVAYKEAAAHSTGNTVSGHRGLYIRHAKLLYKDSRNQHKFSQEAEDQSPAIVLTLPFAINGAIPLKWEG